jgi:hypothetical protein
MLRSIERLSNKQYTIVLITIINVTMGIESKNNRGFCPEGLQAFKTLQRCTTVPTWRTGWTSIPERQVRVASLLQPFPNLARVSYGRFERVSGQCPGHSQPTPPLRLQLVTWLVDPIRDMWSIRVVTRTYVSQYTVLISPRATSSEVPHSRWPTPCMSKISK